MPLRGEYDTEWENEAELAIAGIEFTGEETGTVGQAKQMRLSFNHPCVELMDDVGYTMLDATDPDSTDSAIPIATTVSTSESHCESCSPGT